MSCSSAISPPFADAGGEPAGLRGPNYDEAKVPAFELPSPLDKPDGGRVGSAFEWQNCRRREVLKLLGDEVYGRMPPRPARLSFELLSCRKDALGNTAVRKEYRIHAAMPGGRKHHFDLLLYLPQNTVAPVFLGLNFKGNHTTVEETDVRETGLLRSAPTPRGESERRWQFRELVRRGYASATVCYYDLFPDSPDGWKNSIYTLFEAYDDQFGAHEHYSAIGAWAWGLSRALDCLEQDPDVDGARVAVHGHSRLGKAALWAGANDQRFGLVISNDSGCAGAALYKRRFGETVADVQGNFPHWFRRSFAEYAGREHAMPFDQHFLMALMAPRPLCIASATEDLWADPKGEFLSGFHAGEVYRLFGAAGLAAEEPPPPDTPITGAISYHLRTGKHDQVMADYQHYLDIADLYLKPGPVDGKP